MGFVGRPSRERSLVGDGATPVRKVTNLINAG
jgi:hypothetical protein